MVDLKEVKILKGGFNWKEATLTYKGKTYTATFKQYDEGSKFGINGGRISKLSIVEGTNLKASYDRGWDLKPNDSDSNAILETLLDNEN